METFTCEHVGIVRVDIHDDKRMVEVHWSEASTDLYPFIWLRDNCQCHECFMVETHDRSVHILDFQQDVKPFNVQVLQGDIDRLRVCWNDDHTSDFKADWLIARRFQKETRHARDLFRTIPLKLWDSKSMHNLPKAEFGNVMRDDFALYNFLRDMEETGFVLMKNAPCKEGIIYKMGQRLSKLWKSEFGEVFNLKSTTNTNNIGCTTRRMPLHNDLQHLEDIPGVIMLHCIEQNQSEGGVSEIVDGFHVAKILATTDIKAYNLLTSHAISYFQDYRDQNHAFKKMANHPVIQLNENGDVRRIHLGNNTRDSYIDLAVEQVESMYKALRKFNEICYDQANIITFKLKPGDVMCMDNNRVLHGRSSYTLKENEHRFLQGGFLSWDDLRSRRRVLQSKMGLIE